jgi:DNA modification methylase
MSNYKILQGDCLEQLKTLPDTSVQCCVTSPPYYGLRDYGVDGQIGLEETPEAYVEKLVQVFREVRRVLRDDGTVFLNLGDSYYSYRPGKGQSLVKQSCASNEQDLPQTCARRGNVLVGLKEKDLIGIPWRVAFALQSDGWYLRSEITWCKKAPMPESVKDRPTTATEKIFLLTKSSKYFYDIDAVKEPSTYPINSREDNNPENRKCFPTQQNNGIRSRKNNDYPFRNLRNYWIIGTHAFHEAHFATFPPEIPKLCILAGSKRGDTILDPFTGSGTTGEVALKLDRSFVGCELNQKYIHDLIIPRLENINPLFSDEAVFVDRAQSNMNFMEQ